MALEFLMKFGFKSYNSWDPLKKCLVGSAYTTDFFANYPDSKVADTLCRVNEETGEDLQQLVDILQGEGVDTYRTPQNRVSSVMDLLENRQQIPKPYNAPRDHFFVLGENLIYSKRYHDLAAHIWHPAWENAEDYIEPHFTDTEFAMPKGVQSFDGACIMRAGRDLTVDSISSGGEYLQNTWLPLYNKTYDTNFRAHTIKLGRHTDGVMNLLRPGLIISAVFVENYDVTYPGWEVFKVKKPRDNPYVMEFIRMKRARSKSKRGWLAGADVERHKDYWIHGEEANQTLHDFIDLHFKHGVGHVFETNFDVNILSLDQDTIITSGKNADVEKELWTKYGIKTIVSPMRHRWFWDGGIHCATVDLYREGTCEDYWPDRTDAGMVMDESFVLEREKEIQDNNRSL